MTTISTVLYRSDADKALLGQCNVVATLGGSFSIKHHYSGNWFVEYTINWPTK